MPLLGAGAAHALTLRHEGLQLYPLEAAEQASVGGTLSVGAGLVLQAEEGEDYGDSSSSNSASSSSSEGGRSEAQGR